MAETDDWGPIFQAQPTQPDWDTRSVDDQSMTPLLPVPTRQSSHDSLSPGVYLRAMLNPYRNFSDFEPSRR